MKTTTLRSKYDYPPRQRRLMIHSWFIILFGIIGAMLFLMSCTTSRRMKDPCKERRGMSGYGYGWLKNNKTHQVFVLAPDGAIVCTYYDTK
jgi:hypothetical protein